MEIKKLRNKDAILDSFVVFLWLLNDNKKEILVRCNHDFLSLRPDSEEGEVIEWVDVAHY